ncbi:MAG: MFS transporter [Thermoplasmataceae archaeon]
MDRRIWFLAVTRFIRSFGRGSTFIFLPLVFIISYNQGFLETGVLLGFATLLQSIVQYYSGKWTDLIGRRKILVYTQIPNVLFYFMLFVSVGYLLPVEIAILFWYLTIFINSLQYPAVQASVADVTRVEDRLTGYTLLRLMANFGIAVGPLVGAYSYILTGGFQYIFLIAALSTIVEILMLYLYMRETYFPDTVQAVDSVGKLKKVYRADRLFLYFMIAGIITGFFMRQRGTSLTIFTVVLQHEPIQYLAYIWALNGILVVLLQVPILAIMTRALNSMSWRGIGVIFYAISFIVLFFGSQLASLLIFMTISTVGEDFLSPTTQSIITTLAPADLRGSYIGVYNMYTSIGSFFGAALGLYILYIVRSVSQDFWVYVAVGTAVVSIIYFAISPSFRQRFKLESLSQAESTVYFTDFRR